MYTITITVDDFLTSNFNTSSKMFSTLSCTSLEENVGHETDVVKSGGP